MIISHKYKYIFLAQIKTASTSIERALMQYRGESDSFLQDHPRGLNRHITATELQKRVPSEWDNYFKFSYVRNPWDRMVSCYSAAYHTRTRNIIGTNFTINRPDFNQWAKTIWAKEYIWDTTNIKPHNNVKTKDIPTQIYINGSPVLDFVGRYEYLTTDLKVACEKIGIPYDSSQLPHIHSEYRADKRHYSEWYDDDTREKIAEVFAKDIELFDYTFEDKQ